VESPDIKKYESAVQRLETAKRKAATMTGRRDAAIQNLKEVLEENGVSTVKELEAKAADFKLRADEACISVDTYVAQVNSVEASLEG